MGSPESPTSRVIAVIGNGKSSPWINTDGTDPEEAAAEGGCATRVIAWDGSMKVLSNPS
jgi:hypothetical protein